MRDDIKTAEDILNKWYKPLNKIGDIASIQLIEAMKEYAKQFIDLAAEEAQAVIINGWLGEDYVVDKESILEIKELIK